MIEVRNALSNNAQESSFVWQPQNLDVPVAMKYRNLWGYYLYDGNKNIIRITDISGSGSLAFFRYLPFGEVNSSSGQWVDANPFRFSSEYQDIETGMIYYNYRYYSTIMGRWISRDPIEEEGGVNLYAMVGNDPVNRWDNLGLAFSPAEWDLILNPLNLCCLKFASSVEREIKKMLRERYGNISDGTVTNSIVHCASMCGIASDWLCGYIAPLLGDAHEEHFERDQSRHNRRMDLHNNHVGRSVASNGATLDECIERCEYKALLKELSWFVDYMDDMDSYNDLNLYGKLFVDTLNKYLPKPIYSWANPDTVRRSTIDWEGRIFDRQDELNEAIKRVDEMNNALRN